jgi:hypothetical protein
VFRSRKKKSQGSLSSTSSERKAGGDDGDQDQDPVPPVPTQPANIPKLDPPASKADANKTGSPDRRPRAQTRVDTAAPPRTPPSAETGAPLIVNTPPTPTDRHHAFDTTFSNGTPASVGSNENSPSNSMSTRRLRSGSGSVGPSKLSNITPAPLTPTPENGPLTPSAAASGFFSSMISAAQNAANTLSNSIQNTNIVPAGAKGKAAPILREPAVQEDGDEEPEEELSGDQNRDISTAALTMGKEPAVKTLGSGELSLSQLGIAETSSSAATPVTSKFSDATEARNRSESAPVDFGPSSSVPDLPNDTTTSTRPFSMFEPTESGDRTPPAASVNEDRNGLQRSGSTKSAIGRRRNRGSSAATTGTTIGAAIASANASVAHPNANANAPKLTGFAVASKKRNRDFHALFKSVPDDDYLIEDYSCALQREILAHGRLYVSEGHLCFSSNILGWVTTLVMSFDEIVSVEKRSTALVFKNGLMISTLHAKHIFASFTSRDSTYDLIVNIWKLGHPSLRSTLNGVKLEGTGGDKTEKIDAEQPVCAEEEDDQSASGSDEDSDDGDVYDEDDDGESAPDVTQQTDLSIPETDTDKTVIRKASGVVNSNNPPAETPKDASAPAVGGGDFPGPATHAPTDCGDAASHYDRIVGDDTIALPLGKVYSLMFGSQSPAFMAKWLTGDQKCTELQAEDKKGLSLENKTHSYSYIKPLYAALGPKSTKCIVTETVDNLDYDKAINLSVSTQTPDVPNGNIFVVKTKYCLSWAENNSTRVQVNCTIEWSGKSWIKGTSSSCPTANPSKRKTATNYYIQLQLRKVLPMVRQHIAKSFLLVSEPKRHHDLAQVQELTARL